MDPLRLNDITLNLKQVVDGLKQLRAHLADPDWTRERDQILPFFKSTPQLSAFIGRTFCNTVDRYKHECQILNFFRADLVVGDATDSRFLFVEFEDAGPDSMFVKPRGSTRVADEWSAKLEHGYSQMIDWFWLLEDAKRLPQFDAVFGRTPAIAGLVVAGRTDIGDKDVRSRIRWREEKTIINSRHIFIKSYDQLAADLQAKLNHIAIDVAKGPWPEP